MLKSGQGMALLEGRAIGSFFRRDVGLCYYGEYPLSFAVCANRPRLVCSPQGLGEGTRFTHAVHAGASLGRLRSRFARPGQLGQHCLAPGSHPQKHGHVRAAAGVGWPAHGRCQRYVTQLLSSKVVMCDDPVCQHVKAMKTMMPLRLQLSASAGTVNPHCAANYSRESATWCVCAGLSCVASRCISLTMCALTSGRLHGLYFGCAAGRTAHVLCDPPQAADTHVELWRGVEFAVPVA